MGVLKQRNLATQNLKKLIQDPSSVFCIHYSQSETYDDDYGSISPIITTIVIKSLDEKIDKQFAIHFEADKAGIPKDQIQDSYRELELRILKSFNDFVKRYKNCVWVHWDMKNIHFGFEAIKHRFEKIFEDLEDYQEIPVHKTYCLLNILEKMYGENFVNGPDKLQSLMAFNNNGLIENSFLQRPAESSEFEKKNFKGVIDSVDCKVEFLKKSLNKLATKTLRIQNKNGYSLFLDFISHPIFHFIGWLATIFGLIAGLIALI